MGHVAIQSTSFYHVIASGLTVGYDYVCTVYTICQVTIFPILYHFLHSSVTHVANANIV